MPFHARQGQRFLALKLLAASASYHIHRQRTGFQMYSALLERQMGACSDNGDNSGKVNALERLAQVRRRSIMFMADATERGAGYIRLSTVWEEIAIARSEVDPTNCVPIAKAYRNEAKALLRAARNYERCDDSRNATNFRKAALCALEDAEGRLLSLTRRLKQEAVSNPNTEIHSQLDGAYLLLAKIAGMCINVHAALGNKDAAISKHGEEADCRRRAAYHLNSSIDRVPFIVVEHPLPKSFFKELLAMFQQPTPAQPTGVVLKPI